MSYRNPDQEQAEADRLILEWKQSMKNENVVKRQAGEQVHQPFVLRSAGMDPACGPSATILRAALFAAEKHKNQRRKDVAGTPYINHPIGVASILADAGVADCDTLVAGLLHDTVEDCGVKLQEIANEFGAHVSLVVSDVTDDKALKKSQRKRLQIEHAGYASYPAQLVKLADKIYNVRDLLANPIAKWSPDRIQGYVAWSKLVVDAIRKSIAVDNLTDDDTIHACRRRDDPPVVKLLALFDEACSRTFVDSEGIVRPGLPIVSTDASGNPDYEPFVAAYYTSLDETTVA